MKALNHMTSNYTPWNKGKLIEQKPALKLKEIWSIRTRLQMTHNIPELALFNMATDSKLRGCDLVKLRVSDISYGLNISKRAMITQQKIGRSVQFEITKRTREAVANLINMIELWLLAGAINVDDSTDKIYVLYSYAWPYLRWLLIIILPAIIVQILAKGDFISIRCLDIRTFTNLTDDPELDGANAARRLYRFLSPEPGTTRPGKTISSGFSESKRPAISISAGVATILECLQ